MQRPLMWFAAAIMSGWADGMPNISGSATWDDWTAPVAIVGAPAALDSRQQLVLGAGTVTVPPDVCFAIITDPDLVCADDPWDTPGCQSMDTMGTVTAPGTLLWAPIRHTTCCNHTSTITIAPQECVGGVMTVPNDVGDATGAGISVGTISQLYHPQVQALVASFLDLQSPYIMPLLGGVCAALYLGYSYMGDTQIGRQAMLDALRVAYMSSMLVSGAHGLWHMVEKGFGEYDLLTLAAEVAKVGICLVCYCKDSSMRTVVGEPRLRCFCTRAVWGGGGYALTGNLGATFSVLQGGLNAAWREPAMHGGTRVANVRP